MAQEALSQSAIDQLLADLTSGAASAEPGDKDSRIFICIYCRGVTKITCVGISNCDMYLSSPKISKCNSSVHGHCYIAVDCMNHNGTINRERFNKHEPKE